MFYKTRLTTAVLAIALVSPAVRADVLDDGRTRIVISSGNRNSLSNPFSIFYRPDINNDGQITFMATYNAFTQFRPAGQGVYVLDPTDGLIEIAQTRDPAPNGQDHLGFTTHTGNFSHDGTVTFRAALGGGQYLSIFASSSNDYNQQVFANVGDPAPSGFGDYESLSGYRINRNGKMTFYARTTQNSQDVIFVSDNGGPAQVLVQEGLIAPDVNGSFWFFSEYQFNNADQLFFSANLQNSSNGDADDRGLYVTTQGQLLPTQIAREGNAAPEGNGTYWRFNHPAFNDQGLITYVAHLTGTAGGTDDDNGLYLADTTGFQSKIAREGEAVPGGDGVFQQFFTPKLNNVGQIAIEAHLRDTGPNQNLDSQALYIVNPRVGFTEIVRKGDAVPGTGIVFNEFLDHALNERGQVVFYADTNQGEGIFFFDPVEGIMKVAMKGDRFPSHSNEIFQFMFGATSASWIEGLNDLGQVAYGYRASGAGIAIWDGPTAPVRGDLNGDGTLTNADIASFVLALTDPDAYDAAYPGLNPDAAGDFDSDGQLTNSDITGFVWLLTTSTNQTLEADLAELSSLAVPEPSSLALLGLGGLTLMRRRR